MFPMKHFELEDDEDLQYMNEEDYEREIKDRKKIENAMHFCLNTDSFYLACYSIPNDEIYFVDFFTNAVISSDVRLSKQEERYQKRLEVLRVYWKKIESITGLGKESYLSPEARRYLKRPINSRFIFPETRTLYSSNTPSPIPSVLQSYGNIRVSVKVHLSVFDVEDSNYQLLRDFEYVVDVPFLYVVDSLIKKTISNLSKFLAKKVKEELNNEKLEETGENEKTNNKNFEIDNVNEVVNSESLLREGKKLKTDPHTQPNEKNFKNFLEALEKFKDKKEYQFVLKIEGYEDYLYGDNSISKYDSVIKKIRQFETVPMILFKKAMFEIKAPISRFPPIIFFKAEETFTYFHLLEKYLNQYPDECALFRFGELSDKEKEQFMPIEKKRTETLFEYCESGGCDYPFEVTVNGIYNISSIFDWLNCSSYSANEMMLPYFNEFPTKAQYKESLLKSKILKFFGCSSENAQDDEIKGEDEEDIKKRKAQLKHLQQNEKENQKEKKKRLALMQKSLSEDAKLQKSLNFLRINKKEDVEKNNITKNKFSAYTTFTDELSSKVSDLETNPFYKEEKPTFRHLKFPPVFIRVIIDLLYGSYLIEKVISKEYLISNNVAMNETFTFNPLILFSTLPREARLGVTISVLNKEKSFPIELGSCQVPLFKENGLFNDNDIEIPIWPLFSVEPRVNCCDPFLLIFPDKDKTKEDKDIEEVQKGLFDSHFNEKTDNELTKEIMNNYDTSINHKPTKFTRTHKIQLEDIMLNDKNNNLKNNNNSNFFDKSNYENNQLHQGYSFKKIDYSYYCRISISFPRFPQPLVYSPKDPESYRAYLSFLSENKNEAGNTKKPDIYKEMLNEMNTILKEVSESEEENDDKEENYYSQDNDTILDRSTSTKYPIIEHNLGNIDYILKRDPLSEITPDERKQILLCRDYVSTIPKGIDVFLRCINWFDPVQSYLGHLYLKKWPKLDIEDAIGLLDARFPDVQTRELAIKSLYNAPDDVIELYTLELCQCLFYESYLLNPLADFLIEKSLQNQQLIGNKFFWLAKVASENIMFRGRITIILTEMFMMSGPKFIDDIEFKLERTEEYKNVSRTAKKLKEMNVKPDGDKKTDKKDNDPNNQKQENPLTDKIKKWKCKFSLPIHPSYYVEKYNIEKIKVFDSKMAPIKISMFSSDGSLVSTIFKIGDDLRQDVLVLQLLRIMDNMWLEKDLDLKVLTYNVCPIELKCGFVEFVDGKVLEGLQQSVNLGALDRQLLYNHLNTIAEGNSFDNRIDNYIRSLAGYCVATGLLGIGDRHPANVMIKDNGIFYHIDYGHIFGNFKMKCGFKRERSRFLLTPDMAYVYIQSNTEEKFKNYCVKAYNILRHNGKRLLNLLIPMASAAMPEYSTMADLFYFKHMLHLEIKNDEDAGNYFLSLIRKSVNERYRILDNLIHNWIHIG